MRESLAIDTIKSRSGDYKEFITKYGSCEKHWNGFDEINEQPIITNHFEKKTRF